MTKGIGPLLAASTAIGALCMASAAQAQDTPAQTTEQAQAQSRVGEGDGQTILVTAQRRAQLLQEVPQSVSVVGGETLERQQATSFMDYVGLVPGLSLTQDNPGESRVDLARHQHQFGRLDRFHLCRRDAVRIERQPQPMAACSPAISTRSTSRGSRCCAGRRARSTASNALGGMLKFVTAAPQLSEFSARGQGGVEFVDDGGIGWSGNAVVNVPRRRPGRFPRQRLLSPATPASSTRSAAPARTSTAPTPMAAAHPCCSSRPTISRSGCSRSRRDIRANSPSPYEVHPVTLRPANALTGLPSSERTRFERIAEFNDIDYRLYSGTINWDFGAAILTSATSYSTQDQRQLVRHQQHRQSAAPPTRSRADRAGNDRSSLPERHQRR